VQPEDWEHHREYKEYVVAIEEMLERTDTEWGPWTIVEATDRRWARVKIFQTIIQRLEMALTDRGFELPEEKPLLEEENEESEKEGEEAAETKIPVAEIKEEESEAESAGPEETGVEKEAGEPVLEAGAEV
jgi:hypothetical protein